MIKVICILILILSSGLAQAKNSFSFGVGIGSMYTKVGGNISYSNREHLAFTSFGVINSSTDGTTFGGGLGYINTSLLGGNKKHGIGIYVGLIADEYVNPNDSVDYISSNGITYSVGSDHVLTSRYGASFLYTYFFNGMHKGGLNLGASIGAYKNQFDDITAVPMLQVGYQF